MKTQDDQLWQQGNDIIQASCYRGRLVMGEQRACAVPAMMRVSMPDNQVSARDTKPAF